MAEDRLLALLRDLAPLHGEIDRLHNSLGTLLESDPPLSADVLRDALRKGRNELAKVALRERSVVTDHALAAGVGKGKLPLPFLACHWPSSGHFQLDHQTEEFCVANAATTRRAWRTTPGSGRSRNALLARTADAPAATPLWGHSFAAAEDVDVAATSARSRSKNTTNGKKSSPHLYSLPRVGDENAPPRKNSVFSSNAKSPQGSSSNSSANEEAVSSNQSLRQRRRALRALMRHLENQLASQRAALHEHGLLDGQIGENADAYAAPGAEGGNPDASSASGSNGGSSASVRALEGDLAKVAAALKVLDEHAAAAPHDARFATPLVAPLVAPFLASQPASPPQSAPSIISPRADEVAATLGPSSDVPGTPTPAPPCAPLPALNAGSREAAAYAAYLAALYGTPPPPATQPGHTSTNDMATNAASDHPAAVATSSLPSPPPLQTLGAASRVSSISQPMRSSAADARPTQPAPLTAPVFTAPDTTGAPLRASSPRPLGEATPSAERVRRDAALFASIDDGYSIDEDDDDVLEASMPQAATAATAAPVLSEVAANFPAEVESERTCDATDSALPPLGTAEQNVPPSLPATLAFDCSIAPPEWAQELATSLRAEDEEDNEKKIEEAGVTDAHAENFSSSASLALSSSSSPVPTNEAGTDGATLEQSCSVDRGAQAAGEDIVEAAEVAESSTGNIIEGDDSAAGDSVAGALQGLHLDDNSSSYGDPKADEDKGGTEGEADFLRSIVANEEACLEKESPLKPPPLDLDCCLSLTLSEPTTADVGPGAADRSGIEAENVSVEDRILTGSLAGESNKSLGAFEGNAAAPETDSLSPLHSSSRNPKNSKDEFSLGNGAAPDADADDDIDSVDDYSAPNMPLPSLNLDCVDRGGEENVEGEEIEARRAISLAAPASAASAAALATANQPLSSKHRAVRAIAPLRPIAAGTTPASALGLDIAPTPRAADTVAPPHALSPGSEPTPAARHGSRSAMLQGGNASLSASIYVLGASIPDWPSNGEQQPLRTSEDMLTNKEAAAAASPEADNAEKRFTAVLAQPQLSPKRKCSDDSDDNDDEGDSGSASTVSSSDSASPEDKRTAPFLLSSTKDNKASLSDEILAPDLASGLESRQDGVIGKAATLGGEGPIPGDLSTVDEETPRHDESETTDYTDTTEYTNYSASPTTSPPTGAALAAANHAAAKRQLRLDIVSFDVSSLRPVVATISAVVAPAGDVAALAPPAAAATITSEKDAPTVPDGSCSEDLYVDDENSNETSRALPGATTSFDGVSCDQGLNPHSLRGSADSLIDAVAATRAGIGALRYDTVNRLLGDAFENAWEDQGHPGEAEASCSLPEEEVAPQLKAYEAAGTQLENADISFGNFAAENDAYGDGCGTPEGVSGETNSHPDDDDSAEDSVEAACTVSPLPGSKPKRVAGDLPLRSPFKSPSKTTLAVTANFGEDSQPNQESLVASSPSSSELIENSRSFAQEHSSSLLSAASNSSYESLVGKIVSRGRGASFRNESKSDSYQERVWPQPLPTQHSRGTEINQEAEAKRDIEVTNGNGQMEQKWAYSDSKDGDIDYGSSSQTVEALHGINVISNKAPFSAGTYSAPLENNSNSSTTDPNVCTTLALVPEANERMQPPINALSAPATEPSTPGGAEAGSAPAMRQKRLLAAEAAERRAAAAAASAAVAAVAAVPAPPASAALTTVATADFTTSAESNPLPEALSSAPTAALTVAPSSLPFAAPSNLAIDSTTAVGDAIVQAKCTNENQAEEPAPVPATVTLGPTFAGLTASCDGTAVTANTATTAVSGKRKASRDYDDESFGAYEEDVLVEEAGANANNMAAVAPSGSAKTFGRVDFQYGYSAIGDYSSNNVLPPTSDHMFAHLNAPFGTAPSLIMAPSHGKPDPEVEAFKDTPGQEVDEAASEADRFRTGTWGSPSASGEGAFGEKGGHGDGQSSRQASSTLMMATSTGQQHADGSVQVSFRGSAGASADWSSPDETNRQSLDSVTVGSPVRATAPATSKRDVCEFQPQPLPPHPFHAGTQAPISSAHAQQHGSSQPPSSVPSFHNGHTHPLPPPPPPQSQPNRASWDLLPWSGGAHTHSVDVLDSVVSSLTTDNASYAGIGSLAGGNYGGGFGGAHNFGHGMHNGGGYGGGGGGGNGNSGHYANALPQHMLNPDGSSNGGSPLHHRSAGWRSEASPSLRVRHHSDDVEGLSSGADFKEPVVEKEEEEMSGVPTDAQTSSSGNNNENRAASNSQTAEPEPEPTLDDDEEAAVAAFRAELVLAASASAARGRSAGAGFASGFAAGAAYGLSAMNQHASSNSLSPTSSSSSKGTRELPTSPLAPSAGSKKVSQHTSFSSPAADQASELSPRHASAEKSGPGNAENSATLTDERSKAQADADNTNLLSADFAQYQPATDGAPDAAGTDTVSPPPSPPALASLPLSGSSSVASTPGRLAVRPASLDLGPSCEPGDDGETPRVSIHLAASSSLLFHGSTKAPAANDTATSSTTQHNQGGNSGGGEATEAAVPVTAAVSSNHPAMGLTAPLPWSQASPVKTSGSSPLNKQSSPEKTTGGGVGSGYDPVVHSLSPPLAHALFVDDGGDMEGERDHDEIDNNGATSQEEAHADSLPMAPSTHVEFASDANQNMPSTISPQQWSSPVISRERSSRSCRLENSREGNNNTPPADGSSSEETDVSANASISLTASSILVGLRNGSPGPRHPTNSSRRLDVALAEVGWLTEPSPRADALFDDNSGVVTAAAQGAEQDGALSRNGQQHYSHQQQQQQRYGPEDGLVTRQRSSMSSSPARYSEGRDNSSSSSSERPKSLTPQRKARMPLHGSSRQSPQAWPSQQQQLHSGESQASGISGERMHVSANLSTSPIETGFALPNNHLNTQSEKTNEQEMKGTRVDNEEAGDEEDAELAAAEAQREALWAAAERAAVRRAGLQHSPSPSSSGPPFHARSPSATTRAAMVATTGGEAGPDEGAKATIPQATMPLSGGAFQGSSPFRPPRMGQQVLSPITQPSDSLRRSVGTLEQILERWADEDDDRTLSGRTHPTTTATANASESPARSLVSRAASAPLPSSSARRRDNSSNRSGFRSPVGMKSSAPSTTPAVEVVAGVPLLPPREIPRSLPRALPTFTAAPPPPTATPSRDSGSSFSSPAGGRSANPPKISGGKSNGSSPVVLAPVAAPPSASKRPLPRPPSPAALRAATEAASEEEDEDHTPFAATATQNRGRPYTTTPNRSRSSESYRHSRAAGVGSAVTEGDDFLALSPEPRLPPTGRKLSSGEASSPSILQLRSSKSPPPAVSAEATPSGAGARSANVAASRSSGQGSLPSIHGMSGSGRRAKSAPLPSLPVVSGLHISNEKLLVLSPPEKVSFASRLRSCSSGGDNAGLSGSSARRGQEADSSRPGHHLTNGSSESNYDGFGGHESAEDENNLLPVARGLQFDNEVEYSAPDNAVRSMNDHYSASEAILGGDYRPDSLAHGQVQYENYSAYEEDPSDHDDDKIAVYEDEGSSDAHSRPPSTTGVKSVVEPKDSNQFAGSHRSTAAVMSGGDIILRYPYYANESISDHGDGNNAGNAGDRFLQMSTDEELELAEARGLAEANIPGGGIGGGVRDGGLATYGRSEWRASNDSDDGTDLNPRSRHLPAHNDFGANFDFENSDSSGGYEDVEEEGSTYEDSLSGNNSYAADDSYERGMPPTGNAHSGRGLSGSNTSSRDSFSGLEGERSMSGHLPGGVASAFGRFSSLLAAVDQQNNTTNPVETPEDDSPFPESGLNALATPQNTKSFDGNINRSASALDRFPRSSLPSLGSQPDGGSSNFEPVNRGRTPPPRNPAALLAPLIAPGFSGGGTAGTGIGGGNPTHSVVGRAHSVSPSFSQHVPLGKANQGASLENGGLGSFSAGNSGGRMPAAAATPLLRLRATDPSPTGVGLFYGTPSPQQPPQAPSSHLQETSVSRAVPLYGSHSKDIEFRRGSASMRMHEQLPDLSALSKKEQGELEGSKFGSWRETSELL